MKLPPPFNKLVYFMLKSFNGKNSGVVIRRPSKNTLRSPKSFYELVIKRIDGEEIKFKDFKGKKVLLVNTASACGYTAQYNDLEKLNSTFKEKLQIIGLPSNDFGKQEPGTNAEIEHFCKKNYAVTFPLSAKLHVKGELMDPVYHWLTNFDFNGWNTKQPGWNFCKYLVDEKGELVCFFSEKISPLDPVLVKEITS